MGEEFLNFCQFLGKWFRQLQIMFFEVFGDIVGIWRQSFSFSWKQLTGKSRFLSKKKLIF